MNRIAAGLVMMGGAAAICLDSASAFGAANQTDLRFAWPKNSQFICRGVLAQEQGTYRLMPEQGMLTWCDADIDDKDKRRVLDACRLGGHCEIKGKIRGHGTFGWVEITSVKASPETRIVCYARVYDARHLAEHPYQIVTQMRLCLRQPDQPQAQDVRWFTLQIKRRQDTKTLRAEGVCLNEGSCFQECDMGSFKIELGPASLVLRLERATMAEGCKTVEDNGRGIEIVAGRDDKIFRLQRE